VLRFFTVWDDRGTLFGDLLGFKIHYYLVDDTMEIVPVHERNRCSPSPYGCTPLYAEPRHLGTLSGDRQQALSGAKAVTS
jgi:hypothetical protein